MLKFYKDISFLFFKIFFLLCVSVTVPEKGIEALELELTGSCEQLGKATGLRSRKAESTL